MAPLPEQIASWPTWTDSTEGTTAVNVQIAWSVDDTFDKLWGSSSEFSAHVREARNIKDYSESPWVLDATLMMELEGSGVKGSVPGSPCVFSSHSGYSGHSRMVTFSQGGSGGLLKSAYTNEELQRCVEAVGGESYTMHCTIATNAPYGDRVRIILKYHLQAAGSSQKPLCKLQVLYDLVYIKQTNWGLRSVIASGVDMGVKKNFSTLRDLLSEMVEVFDIEEPMLHNLASAGTADHSAVASSRNAGPASHQFGVFRLLSVSELALHTSAVPIAEWLQGQGLFVGQSATAREAVALGVSMGVVLLMLWTVLSITSFVVAPISAFCAVEGCHPGTGQVVCFFYSIGHLLDPPDSVREVAGSVLLLSLIQKLAALFLFTVKRKDPEAAQISAPETADVGPEEAHDPSDTVVTDPPCGDDGATAEELPARSAVQKQLESFKSGLKDISSSVRELATAGSATRQRVVSKSSGGTGGGSSTQQDSPARPNQQSEGSEQHDPPPYAMVFENERYQPIRGWGHSWPGHFMPRDYSHWSTESDESSMVFRDVCPALPDGYQWVDPDWTVDMSGLEDEAVDDEGWSYGIHWNKLTSPPQPGSGKRKGALFVRRRRWLRKWAERKSGAPSPEPDCKQPDILTTLSESSKDNTDTETNLTLSSTLATVGGIVCIKDAPLQMTADGEATAAPQPCIPVPSADACASAEAVSRSVDDAADVGLNSSLSLSTCAPQPEFDTLVPSSQLQKDAARTLLAHGATGLEHSTEKDLHADLHPQSGVADLDDSFELAAALAEISSTLGTRTTAPSSPPDLDGVGNTGWLATGGTNQPLDHSSCPPAPLLPGEDIPSCSYSACPPAQTGAVSLDGGLPHADTRKLDLLTDSLFEDSPSIDINRHDGPASTDTGHTWGSAGTEGTVVADHEHEAAPPAEYGAGWPGGEQAQHSGETPTPVMAPSISDIARNTADGYEQEGTGDTVQEGTVSGSQGLGNRLLVAKQTADDASAKLMRVVQNSKLGEKLSGAVGKVGGAMVKAGETSGEGKTYHSQSPPDFPMARSVSATNATAGTGLELGYSDQSTVSENSFGWHKRAVSDMRKLAGEVSIDTMGGAAQRVGVEMNVAAKKISGEMNDAAKKLQGLFGRTGTRLGISKVPETGPETSSSHMANQSGLTGGRPISPGTMAAPPSFRDKNGHED